VSVITVTKYQNAPLASKAANTAYDVWTPASGKRVRVLGYVLTADAACRIQLQYSGTPTLIAEHNLAGAGSVYFTLPNGGVVGAANDAKVQVIQQSGGAVGIGATVYGREE